MKRLTRIIQSVNTFYRNQLWLEEGTRIIFFGFLGLLLGKITFFIPGLEGPRSDFREVALLISVFYIRRWYSLFFVCAIATLSTTNPEAYLLNYGYHLIGLVAAYWFFKFLNRTLYHRVTKATIWAAFIGIYYAGLHVPLIIFANIYIGNLDSRNWISGMQNLYYNMQFEMYSTIAISTVYFLVYEANKKLELQNRHLSEAKAKAEESERLKTAFLQNMSHEIRTPLNGIQGFIQLLSLTEFNDEQYQKYIALINESSEQLLKIVSDVIDISEIETQQMQWHTKNVDVSDFVNKVLSKFREKAQMKNLELKIENQLPAVYHFYSDEYKIQRILEHIMDNAIKFTDLGEISLEIKSFENNLQFIVHDTGIGIQDKNLINIFNKFSQVEYSVVRHYGGNGLGLAIAKGYADFLGGKIEVISEMNIGSTFIITIPGKKTFN